MLDLLVKGKLEIAYLNQLGYCVRRDKSIDDVQLIQSNENCCNVIMIDDYRNMFSLTKNLEETS